jgi:hypothetical protein
MFHSYIKSIVHCLKRHPEVRAEDITVVCFGGALQMHVPHCMALLGPNLRWEMWRDDGKFAPLFQEHLSSKVEQHVGTTAQFLASVQARGDRRFICLVDIDINTPEHAFRLNNSKGVTPSVSTENHFYLSFTRPYANMCRVAAAFPHVLVLSHAVGMGINDDFAAADHVVPPSVADVFLELAAEGTVVEETVEAAVDFGGLEDETAALRERDDAVHGDSGRGGGG